MQDHTYALPPSAQDQQFSYQHSNSNTPSPADLEQEDCNSEEIYISSGDSQNFISMKCLN